MNSLHRRFLRCLILTGMSVLCVRGAKEYGSRGHDDIPDNLPAGQTML